ncbi:MAG: tripartite tricarboxylate transporter permease [Sphaerochaetaceae bacterium]|nr:tripartite tricarboxylate transporter permease [Sphaerochaetaceae bacterium]
MLGNFQLLFQGFGTALNPINILACVIGGALGIFVGAMPGIGSVSGCSLLLPITYKMNPTAAIIMLAGIYYGNMYGGAYSAILLNIPGDSPAVCTAMEGYPLSKRGLAGKALFTANFCSFIGGTVGIIFLTIGGPLLANIGLKFGPTETAALVFFALTSIGWMLGDSPAKGLIATGLGVLLSTVGVDGSTGYFRYTFGTTSLLAGINFVPLVIGMFGFTQVMLLMGGKGTEDRAKEYVGKLRYKDCALDKKTTVGLIPQAIRDSILGEFIGFLPGAGGTSASLITYMVERKINKNRANMGKEDVGTYEGVCASEAANNAAAVGAFVPLLSLGIPGSSTTAVLLGGLMAWGLTPGPLLFQQEPDFVWGLIGSMYIGNIVCLALGLLAIPYILKILKIPNNIISPIIAVVCVVGSYACTNNMFDVWVMLIGGVVGYFLNRKGIPAAPLVLSFVLAPIFEQNTRRALEISRCDLTTFITHPISCVFLCCAVIMLMAPTFMKIFKKIFKKG